MPVYFIQAGENGPVKIGHSSNVGVRLVDFQNAHYETLRVIRTIPGSHGVEGWLHIRFAEHKIRGEWFKLVPEMLTIRPDQHADLARLGREFLECKDRIIHLLNTRPDLSYIQVAGMLDIPYFRITNWINALRNARLVPYRRPAKYPLPTVAQAA